MSTTICGKLNKAPNQFQAGESVGFGMRLGVQYYDRETKQKEWTNYEFAIFAKAPAQIQFYQQNLVEGTVIEVTAPTQKVKKFEGQNGLSLSIELIDAKLGMVHTGQQQPQQQQQQQQPQQAGFNQGQQQGGGFGQQAQQNQQSAPPQNQTMGVQGGNQQQPMQQNQNGFTGFGQQQQAAPQQQQANPAPGAHNDFDSDITF